MPLPSTSTLDVDVLDKLLHDRYRHVTSPHALKLDNIGSVGAPAGWDIFSDAEGNGWRVPRVDTQHVAETLTKFASFQKFAYASASLPDSVHRQPENHFVRDVGLLDSGLLSFIAATRPLGTTLPDLASQLRIHLAALYVSIHCQVKKMQEEWFDTVAFDQFKIDDAPPTHLVLGFELDSTKPTPQISKVSTNIYTVLEKLDEVFVSILDDPPNYVALPKFFHKYVIDSHLTTAILEPLPFENSHPLPKVIGTFSRVTFAIKGVLAEWTENEAPTATKKLAARVAILQNISTVAIFFSGVTATTLQYSSQLHPSRFATPFNFLWLLSLLLSTANAMHTQIAIYWHTSRYSRPTLYTTFMVTYTVDGLLNALLLVCSSATFFLGLAYYTFIASSVRSYLAIGIAPGIGIIGGWVIVFFFYMVFEHIRFGTIQKLEASCHASDEKMYELA